MEGDLLAVFDTEDENEFELLEIQDINNDLYKTYSDLFGE